MESNFSIAARRVIAREPELGRVLLVLTFTTVKGLAPCRVVNHDGELILECGDGWLCRRSVEQLVTALVEIARQVRSRYPERF